MRIALFGGSFNPPHVGHQLAALYVLETAPIDELWFVPAFRHPFDKPLCAFEDRLRMCQLAAAALGPRVRVSDIEATLGGPSRTLRTVQKLLDGHPGDTFSLVIGTDLVEQVDSWSGATELRRLISFLVVGRAGRWSGRPAPDRIVTAPSTIEIPDVSSTEVREALAAGRPVAHHVPKSVLDYIASRGLYGSSPPVGH